MPPTRHGLPRGPRRPAFVQTLEWLLDPEGFMRRCARRHGPAFTVRLGPSADVVFLAEPGAVQAVFRGPPEQMRMGDINGLFRRVLGHNSLLVLDGEEHLRQRRLLLPPFHGERIAEHREAMTQAAERHVAAWPAGRPFALQPSLQAMTLDVILHVVFGMEPGPRRDTLRRLLARLLELNATLATVLPQLRVDLGGRSPWGRLMRCTAAVDEALYAEIARRRTTAHGSDGDVLSLLLAARDPAGEPMSDSELRDQLLTMLVAGHETTATALAWAFERLVRHPAAMARLRDELASGATAYLDAVIKETLRVRPVVPIVGRKLTADVELDGRRFPAGTVLMPCVFLVHRNAAVYAEPAGFRPERFLEGQPPSYAWIPFGGGVRRCIGAGFALVEMQAVIRTVLERVELSPWSPRDERVVRRAFTLSPSRGARVVVTGRLG
jgi:cytochrome P450